MQREILKAIGELSQERILVAIDGRCASGKTTLARDLQAELDCSVFHMDDFFLRPTQRTPQRYAEPGGNVDRERMLEEVIEPFLKGAAVCYRPFDCHTMTLQEPILVQPRSIAILEGTYSCHPVLWDLCDLHIFLTTSRDKQLSRIAARNSSAVEAFAERWIPLEEQYFSAFSIERRCELQFIT